MCVDRGAEMALPSAEGGHMLEYMPRWMSLQGLQSDVGAAPDDVLECEPHPKRLMPHALLSAGFCHCLNNIENDMDKKFTWWPQWLEGFRAVMGIFGRPDLLEQFRERCVKPSRWSIAVSLFNTEAPKLKG